MSNVYWHSPKFPSIKGRISYQSKPEMSRIPPENVSPKIIDKSDSKGQDDKNGQGDKKGQGGKKGQDDKRENNNSAEQSSPKNGWLYLIFFVLGVSIFVRFYNATLNKETNIDALKQIFPNQPNETFENFEAVIDDILYTKEIHPAVFLFLYSTNETKVNNLIHHLAKYTSFKLQTNTDYIDVSKDEFHRREAVSDYGYLLDKYKSDLLNKKVMVVKNLQDIPAHVAQVFHSFCDEISPLVEKVVYIFTLKVGSLAGKEENIAELNLKRVWDDLDNDILMPLITRVTSTVLKVSN